MLKTISPNLEDFKVQPVENSNDTANNVFKVFHGFYGNLFLSKFVNGQMDADGVDQGVVSARGIWSHGLRGFDLSTVKTALGRTMDVHTEFPPTLPQFVALCKACKPREVYSTALPPPAVDRTAQARKARELLDSMKAEKPAVNGLSLLFIAIADAVRCAGGDEGAELARLERMFKGAAA